MPEQSVEKSTFLCYPFDNHVAPIIAQDHARHRRSILAFGRGHMAGTHATAFLGTVFFAVGKRRPGSGAFRARRAPVYPGHPFDLCKQQIGMACKRDLSRDAGSGRNRDFPPFG